MSKNGVSKTQETEVFWLGGPPGGANSAPRLADTEQFVVAITRVCEEMDCQVDRFVSAKGVYGTWLVELSRNAGKQRVVWNGKDKKLSLQVERSHGGWDDAAETSVALENVDGFIEGVRAVLGRGIG